MSVISYSKSIWKGKANPDNIFCLLFTFLGFGLYLLSMIMKEIGRFFSDTECFFIFLIFLIILLSITAFLIIGLWKNAFNPPPFKKIWSIPQPLNGYFLRFFCLLFTIPILGYGVVFSLAIIFSEPKTESYKFNFNNQNVHEKSTSYLGSAK